MAARQQVERLLRDLTSPGGGAAGSASSSSSSSSSDGGGGSIGRSMAAAEQGSGHAAAGDLAARVSALLQERKAVEARHAAELARRDAQAEALRRRLEGEVAAIAARQAEVEAAAPGVAAQLAEARDALLSGDVAVALSPERARQLRALPPDRLALADAVRLAVLDGTAALQAEADRLRRSGEAAQQAARRAGDECNRLRRDNARLEAAAAERDADGDAAAAALERRCARLASELGEAAAAAEVLAAKGRQYDEVAARAAALEDEVARLKAEVAAAAEAHARLRESEGLRAALEARLAAADVDCQHAREAVGRLEAAVVARDDKVASLKRERAELRSQLASAVAAGPRNEAECRLAREAKLLQDSRDEAADEAARAKEELRHTAAALADAAAAAREERVQADARIAGLAGELRLRSWELQQAQELCKERAASLQRAEARAAVLEDKAAALAARSSGAEVEAARLSVQLDAAVAQLAAYEAAEMGLAAAGGLGLAAVPTGPGRGGGGWGPAGALGRVAADPAQQGQGRGSRAAADAAKPLRALGLQALVSRCSQLEARNEELASGSREAEAQLVASKAEAQRLRDQVGALGRPAKWVGEQVADAQARAREAEERADELLAALQERDVKSARADQERCALRADLERLLRERGAVQALRSLVEGALVNAGGAAALAEVCE